MLGSLGAVRDFPDDRREERAMSREPPHATDVIQIAHPPEHDTNEAEVLRSVTRTCSEAVGVAAAAVLLADADGNLSTAAATGDPAGLADLFDLQSGAGPCADSYHTASAIVESDLAAHPGRWPAFAPLARSAGVRGALAVPMRWHTDTIGVLGMLSTRADAFGTHDAALGQCLADMASRCMYYQQSARSAWTLAGQLQTALDSRVVIEQAKGMLAQRFGLVPDRAFEVLRTYCRTNRLKLTDVCGQIIDSTLDANDIIDAVPTSLARQHHTTGQQAAGRRKTRARARYGS